MKRPPIVGFVLSTALTILANKETTTSQGIMHTTNGTHPAIIISLVRESSQIHGCKITVDSLYIQVDDEFNVVHISGSIEVDASKHKTPAVENSFTKDGQHFVQINGKIHTSYTNNPLFLYSLRLAQPISHL